MTTPGSNPSLAGKVLHTVGSATHTCAPRLGQQQTPHILCYSHVCASLAVDSRRGGARCRRGVAPRDSPLRPRRHPLALLRGRRAARAQRGAGRTAAPLARRGRPDQGRHALRLALRLAPGEPGGHSGAIGVPAAPRRGAAAWWHIGGATKAQPRRSVVARRGRPRAAPRTSRRVRRVVRRCGVSAKGACVRSRRARSRRQVRQVWARVY